MKLKFAAIAAVAAMLAAPAFAFDTVDLSTVADAATADETAIAEFGDRALSGTGNTAFIVQETSNSVATIDQLGLNNFASIVQSGEVSLGVVNQLGDENLARIYQRQ